MADVRHLPAGSETRNGWTALALVLALVGTAGSLSLSLALGLKACPLCFYQRSFVMGVFAVLAVGLAVDRSQAGLYSLLALPLSFAGLGVAAFHEYLVLSGVLECPPGLLGLGSSPAQSLLVFVVLSAAVVMGAQSGRLAPRVAHVRSRGERPTMVGAIALGLLLAWGSIASSPPLPPTPTQAYDPVAQPLEMCRPPYRGE